MGCYKTSSQREFYSNTDLAPKRRKISNQQLKPPPKELEKEHRKPKVSRRKEIIKKQKRQSTEWEKILADNATEKGLISKIY